MKTEVKGIADGHAVAPAPLWAALVATFFGLSRMRPGPGTWGSAPAAFIWFGLAKWLPITWQPAVLGALAVMAMLLGIPAAS